MSSWKDQYLSAGSRGVVDENLWGEIILEIPTLVEAMTGSVDDKGSWVMGPATLMMFVEGGKLKFCLSPKYTAKVCFGPVDDVERPFLAIEKALQDGRCEWKARAGKH